VSCRDSHGKRLQFDGKPFATDVNHAEADAAAAKEKENEFIKVLNSQKLKKPASASGSRGSLGPMTPRFEEQFTARDVPN
jgi:hypothetical protein